MFDVCIWSICVCTGLQALQSADMTEVVSEEWLCKVVLLLFDYVANGEFCTPVTCSVPYPSPLLAVY